MLGPLLVAMGLLGFYAFFKGRAHEVLDALTNNGFSTSLDNALGNLNLSSPAGSSGGSGSSSQSSSKGSYSVPIIGPDGTAGTITVNASDAAAAFTNAFQGGNTPTGSAKKV